MKKLVLSTIIVVISLIGISQNINSKDISFNTGDIYKSNSRAYAYLAYLDNSIISVKIEKDDIVVRIFDPSTLNIVSTKHHPIKGGHSSHYFIEDLVISRGACYFFFSQYDKKKELEQLYYCKIDPGTGHYIGEPEKIITINEKIFSDYGSNKFKFVQSANKSKLLIYYRKRPEAKNDKKSTDSFGLFVYNQNLQKLWSTEVKMPYTESAVDNLDYQLSNAGEALFLTTVFTNNTSKMEKKKGKVNYHLELLKIKDANSGIQKYPITIENKLLKSVNFKEMPNGDMVIGGIYTNKKDRYLNLSFETLVEKKAPYDSDGTYGIRIDAEGNTIYSGYHEFPLSFLNSYEKKSEKKKNTRKGDEKVKVEFHSNRKTIIDDDGSIICIGEQSYRKTDNGDRHVNNINYFYDDISVSKISPDMKLDWIEKLPKRQVAYNQNETPLEISFIDFSDGSNLYFLFKDDIDNIKLTSSQSPKKCNVLTKGILALCKVDIEDGKVSKSAIMKAEGSNKTYIREVLSAIILETVPGTIVLENHVKSKDHSLTSISVKN